MSDDLPMGWELVGFPEVVFFQEGPGLRKYQYRESGIPFLNIRTFVDERIDKKLCNYLDVEEVEQKYKHFLVDANDILVATSGSIGKMAIAKPQDLPLMLNTSIMRFRPITEERLERGFLYFFLKSDHFFTQAESAWTGTAQKNMGPSHVKTFNIMLPPLNEQRRIVDKLDRLGDHHRTARNELSHIPKLIARYKQAVLAAACSGKLTEDWREKNPNVDSVIKLIEVIRENKEKNLIKVSKNISVESFSLQNFENELPEIPDTWLWCSLGSYANCSRGKFTIRPRNDPKYFDGQYPFIQIGDLPREGGYILAHRQTLNDDGLSVSKMFSSGTVVIAIVGATIGNTGILSYDMCFPDSLVGIDTGSQYGNFYLEYYLRSQKENIRNFSYAGGGQPNIKLETLNLYPFPLPPLEEQQEIVNQVEKLFKAIDRIEQEHQKASVLLDRLEQTTLAKAFRGELVPQDPNDEPAAILLERIRRERPEQPKTKTGKSRRKPQTESL